MIQQTDETWVNIQKLSIILGILGALFSIGFTWYRYQQEKKNELAAVQTTNEITNTIGPRGDVTSSFAGEKSKNKHTKMIVNKVI